ncbi:hypothetical protein A2853_03685 [Candidatus Kaiserbacteria bacterium RIFCSPHIGHO2_01_FULL_55_17]|uniref:ABC transporter substrate-binding protein n=1 Tax=Candidatus Kaiserbacteria bacterium RIFCSPHIGHO2_01_FULL_55_17 TaxID=1798484 RepID=A0A1F6D7N0_9BACT|nr:MAG: hypothetical protein A2853_03685 [Candidatus Kaiserbacteria bacterium RIFCSPHIGHO2_01_FULL_55_17]
MSRNVSLGIVVVVGALVLAVAFYLLPKTHAPAETVRTEPLRVGVVQHTKGLDSVYEGFKQGMTELGYVEGTDITYEYQFSEGDPEKVRDITRAFIAQNVDMLFVMTSSAAKVVVPETKAAARDDIPVVFTNGVTVLSDGTVASYRSSGNNATGLVPDDTAISIKKLEFLKQINPKAKKVGVFISKGTSSNAREATLAALREGGAGLGIEILTYEVPLAVSAEAGAKEVAATIKSGAVDALMTIPDPPITAPPVNKVIADLGIREKIPTMLLNVGDGGLLAYNLDLIASGKQAATMADRIFRGAKPSDIPIEFPRKNILFIDLGVAKKIGVTIPESLIYAADRVVPAEGETQ